MRRVTTGPAPCAVAAICLLAGFTAGLLQAGTSPEEIIFALGIDRPAAREEEPSRPSTPDSGEPARILFVGDVLPLGDRDYFARVAPLIASADFAVANLECPISSHGVRTPLKLTAAGRTMHNEFFFRAPPAQAMRLADAGFSAVTLANNHVMDFGGEALLETFSLLDDAGILHTGAGRNRVTAREPVVATVRGQSVAILAYADAATLPGTAHFAATDRTAGTVFVRGDGSGRLDADSAQMLRDDIAGARERADVVIASFHWGTETSDEPDPLQRSLAHLAIDAGAEIVVGHHPHVLQGVEIYRGRPIAYSLGNFAFPTPWESNQLSAALEVRIEDGGWGGLTWHPVRLEHGTGIPAPAQGADATRIMGRIKRLSEALGTVSQVPDGRPPRLEIDRDSGGFGVGPAPTLPGMSEVRFLAWDIEHGRKVSRARSVVVAQELAEEVAAIFRDIYEHRERFPIHEVIGYDHRTVAGSEDRLSWHALGRAIDINRAQNPMLMDGATIVHPARADRPGTTCDGGPPTTWTRPRTARST
jgi:poly-gamma-glutamate capsule biosynthesis protein CapA/YwtB (metallophosphatase superfamily)